MSIHSLTHSLTVCVCKCLCGKGLGSLICFLLNMYMYMNCLLCYQVIIEVVVIKLVLEDQEGKC